MALHDFHQFQVAGCDEEIVSALTKLRSDAATPQPPLLQARASPQVGLAQRNPTFTAQEVYGACDVGLRCANPTCNPIRPAIRPP